MKIISSSAYCGSFMSVVMALLILSGCVNQSSEGGKAPEAPSMFDGSTSKHRPDRQRLFVLNARTAWIGSSDGTTLFRTDNRGESWITLTRFPIDFKIDSFTFLDENAGFAVGGDNGVVMKTENGGQSWLQVGRIELSTESRYYFSNQIIFLDQMVGWIQDAFTIWHTIDGGQSWSKFNQVEKKGTSDGPIKILLGNSGDIYGLTLLSLQGGKQTSGQFTTLLHGDGNFSDAYIDPSNIIYVGERTKGLLFVWNFFEQRWDSRRFPVGFRVNAVSFFSKNEGLAVGSIYTDFEGEPRAQLLRTFDGGNSWISTVFPRESRLVRIFAISRSEVWLEGMDAIYKSVDGGVNFSAISIDS